MPVEVKKQKPQTVNQINNIQGSMNLRDKFGSYINQKI